MAKALFGHVGVGTDLRLAAEVRRLRSRVSELEQTLARVQAVNDVLASSVHVDDDLRLLIDDSEPALT
jgi:hypothetical protein